MELHVFQVNEGQSYYFDVAYLQKRVDELTRAIRQRCEIQVNKQVVIASGGVSMEPAEKVNAYNAGTDNSPIFLFDLSNIESKTLELYNAPEKMKKNVGELIEKVRRLPVSIGTLTSRTHLAQEIYTFSEALYNLCKELVNQQHLQHQGWSSAVANLDDVVKSLDEDIQTYLKHWEAIQQNVKTGIGCLKRLRESAELLDKLPVLQVLKKCEKIAAPGVGRDESFSCLQLLQYESTEALLEEGRDLNTALLNLDLVTDKLEVLNDQAALNEEGSNSSMKLIGGLEDRLSHLHALIQEAEREIASQLAYKKSFELNLQRCRELADPQVLPDLCASHIEQFNVMWTSYERLSSICKRCFEAKQEFSNNLHMRLKWVLYIEQRIGDLQERLTVKNEFHHRLKLSIERMRQIVETPKVYITLCAEVYRRHVFNARYQKCAQKSTSKVANLYETESEKRKEFFKNMGQHFLKSFFPGLEFLPPAVMSTFEMSLGQEDKLPNITLEELEILKKAVPMEYRGYLLSVMDCDLANTSISSLDSDVAVIGSPGQEGEPVRKNSPSKTAPELFKAESITNLAPAGGILLMPSDDENDDFYDATEKAASLHLSPRCLHEKDVKLWEPLLSRWSESRCYQEETVSFQSEVEQLTRILGRGSCKDTIDRMITITSLIMERYHTLCVKLEDSHRAEIKEKAQSVSLLQQQHESELKACSEHWENRIQEENEELYANLINLSDQVEQFKEQLLKTRSQCRLYRDAETNLKTKYNHLKGCAEAERDKYNLTVAALEQELRLTSADLEQDKLQFNSLNSELNTKLEALQQKCAHQIEAQIALKKEYDNYKQATQADIHLRDGQLAKLSEEFTAYQEELKNAQDEVIRLKKKCELDVKNREEQLIVEFSQKHDAELELLKNDLSERRCQEMQVWKERINQLKNEMQEAHNAELNLVTDQMEKEFEHRANSMKQSMLAVGEAQVEEKLANLKKENEKLRRELQRSLARSTSSSSLSASYTRLNESVAASGDMERSEINEPAQLGELQKKIAELEASSAGSGITDKISVKSFSPGDQAILCYDDSNGHYVVLTTSSTKHFLHADSVKELNLGSNNLSRPSWLIAEIVEKEYCEAKKETNRFKVKAGSRFYRVKVKKSSIVGTK